MTLELWLTYALAAGVLLAIPGPTILLVVSYALTGGRRAAWNTVAGVVLGDLTAMTLSFVGLGAVLSTSATAFTVLKWIGAAYLVYLGIRMWMTLVEDGPPERQPSRSGRAMLGHAFTVTALNPKGIVFFVAFVPQFLVPAAPMVPQLLLLGGTFLFLAFLNAAGYAWLAGRAGHWVRKPAVQRTTHRIGGTLLIGAGLLTAAARRGA